jgi:transcription initiation factor IIE alpha subunit
MCSNCDEDGMLVEISNNRVISGLSKEIDVLEKEIDKFRHNGYAK